jgi:hypothetical protein
VNKRMTLHLGVLVQPYRSVTAWRRRKKYNPGPSYGALTTADVAQFLENRYGVMAAFYRMHTKDVAQEVVQSLEKALESLLMRQPVDLWGRATQRIETMFRDFISTQEAERAGIPGTPTKAALRGVNHRLAHPYAKGNARRPSFRDTGLYVGSFKSWVD